MHLSGAKRGVCYSGTILKARCSDVGGRIPPVTYRPFLLYDVDYWGG
jgi:hypothetical protein